MTRTNGPNTKKEAQAEPDHLGVDGGVDPGQSPAEVVQLLCKHLLAFLELLQDVGSLQEGENQQEDVYSARHRFPVRVQFFQFNRVSSKRTPVPESHQGREANREMLLSCVRVRVCYCSCCGKKQELTQRNRRSHVENTVFVEKLSSF